MIRTHSQNQRRLSEFDWPFQVALDENNRWIKLSQCIPWDEMAEGYYQSLSKNKGRPAKDARLVIGAVIIKHRLCLSDEETVAQIRENPYLQYFVGLPGYQMKAPFVPSLFVEIRKRMGRAVFDVFQQSLVDAVEKSERPQPPKTVSVNDSDDRPPSPTKGDDQSVVEDQAGPPSHQGKLIIDASVAPQAIRYPTDLGLLNEARECSEKIIDALYPQSGLANKPRTYRQKARKSFLSIAKQRRPSKRVRRKAMKQQLQYLRRNLKHIEKLLSCYPEGKPLPLPSWLLHRYWVIQHLYSQQWDMYQNKSSRCDDRIVSISQPYVRPIVRGKPSKPVEFGAKLSVSLTGRGLSCVDELRWDAFNESQDLQSQVESYKQRYGRYPEVVIADSIYGNRDNRRWLKNKGIRFAGKPLGRAKKETEENRDELNRLKAQRREEYLQRIPIEGKFGQGKSGYGLNGIKAKRADTSFAWINSIFLVMNLLILLEVFFMPFKKGLSAILIRLASLYTAWIRRALPENSRISAMEHFSAGTGKIHL